MSVNVEGIIHTRLECFFTKHQIINKAQYGFQKGKSTESALLDTKEEILKNMENRTYTIGLFIDLKKAFDTVKHEILISKLHDYGVRGVAAKLIKGYLTERKQYVRVGNIVSPMKTVKSGVPQGSILGPLLFITYINDLCDIPRSPKLIIYADDTNIFFTGRILMHLEDEVNDYLLKLENWLHQNQLMLNISKSKYIVFQPINKPHGDDINIFFKNQRLEQVKSQKFLGVWFQENLSWNTHVDKLESELSKTVGCIFKLNSLIPIWLKKKIYYALFYSRLNYSMLVWGTTSEKNLNKLEILQKKVLRLFENYYGNPREMSSSPLFIKHRILKARQVYEYKLLLFIYKNKLHTMTAQEGALKYSLRRQLIHVPATRTGYGRALIAYRAPQLLNHLGEQLNFNLSLTQFKYHLKDVLVNGVK